MSKTMTDTGNSIACLKRTCNWLSEGHVIGYQMHIKQATYLLY